MIHFLCLPLFLSSLLDCFLLQAHRAIHSYSGVLWKYFHPCYVSVLPDFLSQIFYPSFPFFLYRTTPYILPSHSLSLALTLSLSLFPSPFCSFTAPRLICFPPSLLFLFPSFDCICCILFSYSTDSSSNVLPEEKCVTNMYEI